MSFLMVHLVGVYARAGRIKEGCDEKSHPSDFIKKSFLLAVSLAILSDN